MLTRREFFSILESEEKGSMTSFLLKNGLDLNSKIDECCLLELALRSTQEVKRRMAIMKSLLDAGASATKIDNSAFIPLLTAVRLQNLEAIQLLLNKGAIVDKDTVNPDIGESAWNMADCRAKSPDGGEQDKTILKLLTGQSEKNGF